MTCVPVVENSADTPAPPAGVVSAGFSTTGPSRSPARGSGADQP